MSDADEVVELLGALADSDRRWILERLPETAKTQLAERIASTSATAQPHSLQPLPEESAASIEAREREQCVARISAADVSMVLRVLRDEPTWLVRAVLQLRDWPWRKMFRQSSPATMRIEGMQMLGDKPTLGRAAESWLLRELSAKLAALPPEPNADSRFATLLARATKKPTRR